MAFRQRDRDRESVSACNRFASTRLDDLSTFFHGCTDYFASGNFPSGKDNDALTRDLLLRRRSFGDNETEREGSLILRAAWSINPLAESKTR